MSYSFIHREVAEIDFGIQNLKAYSTGFLIKYMRNRAFNCFYEPDTEEEEYWRNELVDRLRDELAKRPHLSNKRERKKAAKR